MKRTWWHDKVAYQIYPKSFYDTNDDGIGDIRGIIEKLDYLKMLGIDIIWVSPIYQSPFVDQGYDISDYYAIDPAFGTMNDFEELLEETKKRDMYLIMDLVVNHCSDQHEWFQKALKDPEGEYGQYFYLRKGKEGHPPSGNYRSYFGGSVWEPIEGTEYYYFHAFAKEQPDLNWTNPKVRKEIYRMINWWLEKGVAGFRIDAIINIKKDLDFPDMEPDGKDGLVSYTKFVESVEGVEEMLQELKQQTFAKYDAFTIAELFNEQKDVKEYIGAEGCFSTIFDFGPHLLTLGEHGWYDAKPVDFKEWRKTIFEGQLKCGDIGFEANIIENHDEPRGVNTYLPPHAQNDVGKKMLATVTIMLRGLPFLYQGQEIGMENCRMESVEEYNDINTKDQYQLARSMGLSEEETLLCCYRLSRDNARTPMQWSEEKNAGFTKGVPWLKVNPNYHRINIESQIRSEDSLFSYYKELIALRKSAKYQEVLTYGEIVPEALKDTELLEDHSDRDVIAFSRRGDGKKILIAANFGTDEVCLSLKNIQKITVLVSNMKEVFYQGGELRLRSCEAVVLEII